MADESQVAELRAEVAELRAEITSVRAQLDAARLEYVPSMRARLRCPACGCARLAHAEQVVDQVDSGNRPFAFFTQLGWWLNKPMGELEAFACTGCGIVEWYVKDPKGLQNVKGHVTILDGETPDAGPYR